MFTRRHLLTGGTASIALTLTPKSSRGQSRFEGCRIAYDQAETLLGSEQIWLSYDSVQTGSGDRDFDRALAQTLEVLSDRFFVLPGFAFFNEPGSSNAFACRTQQLGRSDGSVLFGRKLFREIMSGREHPEIGIVSVCAHEFGHIAQYKYDVYDRLVGMDRRVKRLVVRSNSRDGSVIPPQQLKAAHQSWEASERRHAITGQRP